MTALNEAIPLSIEAVSIAHVWSDPSLRATAFTMWDTCARQSMKGKDIDPFETFRMTREEADKNNLVDSAAEDANNAQSPSAEDNALADIVIDKADELDVEISEEEEDETPIGTDSEDDGSTAVDYMPDPEDAELELVVPKKFGQVWHNYAKMLEVFWGRCEYLKTDEDSILYYDTYLEEAQAGYALVEIAARGKMSLEAAVSTMELLDRFSTVVNKKVLAVISSL